MRRGERDANVANFDNRVDGFELLAEELLRASDVAGVPLHEANLFWFGLETDTFLSYTMSEFRGRGATVVSEE